MEITLKCKEFDNITNTYEFYKVINEKIHNSHSDEYDKNIYKQVKEDEIDKIYLEFEDGDNTVSLLNAIKICMDQNIALSVFVHHDCYDIIETRKCIHCNTKTIITINRGIRCTKCGHSIYSNWI